MISPVMPTYGRFELAFEKGDGPYLYTTDGKRFLDFGSGIAVTALGHAHPHLVAALKDQAEKLWHTSNLYEIPGQRRLAERLVENSFADTAFFCNSGAEALECSIKMARKYHSANGSPEKYRVITAEGAFHGRTLATLAAGGQAKHLEGFGPVTDGFDQVSFGNINELRGAITPETAAILVEPIQGEGGIRPIGQNFLKGLRAAADEFGLLLIFDEVQTGMGRTGHLFAHEKFGITPDIMALAKGLGGGFPVGACLATSEAAKGMTPGTHGSTFGGNPLACAAANAVLDILLADGFIETVRERADYFKGCLEALVKKYSTVVSDVRGAGLLVGLKCLGLNSDLVAACLRHGLLIVPAGDNVIRLLPPLNITKEQLDEALELLEASLKELEG